MMGIRVLCEASFAVGVGVNGVWGFRVRGFRGSGLRV